jgi:hypothetical protein
VGRALVELGHTLSVYTFYPYSFHGAAITGKDEPYVTRCFTTSRYSEVKLDPRPILTGDYNYFIVEDHGMIPNDPLGKIFHRIRQKAKTVAVIHDGRLSEDPGFYQFAWDAIVAFDRRYEAFIKKGYPQDRVVRIPFPSFPYKPGDQQKARKKLGLPLDKKIGFVFGPAASHAGVILPTLSRSKGKEDFLLVAVTKDQNGLKMYTKAKKGKRINLEIREQVLDLKELYEYLWAADITFFHKESAGHVVLSSTIHQCLGAGCPFLAYESNFSNYFGDEVIRYRNFKEFPRLFKDILAQGPIYRKQQQALKKYLAKNDGKATAQKFITLLQSL